METRITYCRICEAACGLLADVEGDELRALRPDPDHVVSRGFACAKGTRFGDLHQSPDRVDHPLMREGELLEQTSWNAAISDIGQRLARIRRAHGPHAVGVYVGNPSAFSYSTTLLSMAFIKGLRTKNAFNAGSLDCNNKFVVSRRMFGSPALHPVPDLDRAHFALLVGTNPSVSQSSFINAPRMIERLKGIEARGGSVIVVDPRRTETAKSVGTHLPIAPDTDAAFLLGLLHVVFAEQLECRSKTCRHARGLDELRAASLRFPPEKVERATGIPAATLRDIARRFALANGAFCHVSTGVNQGRYGNIAYAAKIALELVTGNLDREGGALMPHGAIDAAGLLALSRLDREPRWKSRIGNLPPVMGALPAAILADEILTPGAGQIRALVVIAGNPLLSAPDGTRLRRALQRLELCVSIDLFQNDTAAYASHVLPCTDFLERDDLPLAQMQLQPVPYVQYTERVVTPRAERREEWRILLDLARAAHVPLFGSRAADLALRATLSTVGPRAMVLPLLTGALGPRPRHVLRENPHGVLVRRERPGQFLSGRIQTRSGRVELFPQEIYAQLGELERSLEEPARGGPGLVLKLITRRERLGHNSWMHASRALRTGEQRAYLSPADAERLGVRHGDRVRLSTDSGSIELPAEPSDEIVPGAIAVPHGYGHEKQSGWHAARLRGGANVNLLAASGPRAVDPLSGMCRFVGIPVHVERIADRPSIAPHGA
jgi:formate dehydrogenase